jgi:AcrR family transcriptional regulator
MLAVVPKSSPDAVAASPAKLSPVQAQIIVALAQGRTITAAAAEAGIHRNTIHNWFRDPEFKAAVNEAQQDYVETLNDGLRGLAARALETLRELLDDPKTPPSIRLKASLFILQRPQFPNQDWHLPERIKPPQQVRDNLAKIQADYQATRMTNAIETSALRKEAEAGASIHAVPR